MGGKPKMIKQLNDDELEELSAETDYEGLECI